MQLESFELCYKQYGAGCGQEFVLGWSDKSFTRASLYDLTPQQVSTGLKNLAAYIDELLVEGHLKCTT